MMTRKPARSLSTMLVTLGLATVTFLTTGCGPVIFIIDETRATGGCPWPDDELASIVCVSFRTNRESLPVGYTDGLSHRILEIRRSADLRSI
jgi:hypothetical protein